jgi:hypothetical protein
MDNDGSISYETMPLAKLDTAKFQSISAVLPFEQG